MSDLIERVSKLVITGGGGGGGKKDSQLAILN